VRGIDPAGWLIAIAPSAGWAGHGGYGPTPAGADGYSLFRYRSRCALCLIAADGAGAGDRGGVDGQSSCGAGRWMMWIRRPSRTLGPLLERHGRFPNRTNVGFMQIVAPDQIRLRVFERGTGETWLVAAALALPWWRAVVGVALAECPGGTARRRINHSLGGRR
jgi:hypothetical protein